jgi:hypothetical protein
MDTPDNLEAAMHTLADSIKPTIPVKTTNPTQQVLIRTTPTSHARWKQTAALQGISLNEYLRRLADTEATRILDCTHPHARINRWGAWCDQCGRKFD